MNREQRYRATALLFILIGLLVASVPLATDEYSAYYQSRLLAKLEAVKKKGLDQKTPQAEVASEALFVIEIPALNLRAAVVKGTGFADLMKGPGWYTDSALPGKGNTAIAGHRTMFGAWFNKLHTLKLGDEIILYYENKVFRYRAEKIFKVSPEETGVLGETGYPALTLTTCEPIGRATQRLVVRARLIEIR